MKQWPVPSSPSREVPKKGMPGSFWEDRGDRHHCGVDIYAPRGSEVVSLARGVVLATGVFTSPEDIPYWNVTFYAVVRNEDGLFCRYAELGALDIDEGDAVVQGQTIGRVGQVLEPSRITEESPEYIKALKRAARQCMLHLEVYSDGMLPMPGKGEYLGGNWFGSGRPPSIVDAGDYLARQ